MSHFFKIANQGTESLETCNSDCNRVNASFLVLSVLPGNHIRVDIGTGFPFADGDEHGKQPLFVSRRNTILDKGHWSTPSGSGFGEI